MNQDISTNREHSGLGIASIIFGVINGIVMVGLFAFAGYLESTTPGGIDDQSPVAIIASAGMLLTIVFIAMRANAIIDTFQMR